MDAPMNPAGRTLAVAEEVLRNEDPERLAYNEKIAMLREQEYPMLKGM